ncbi:hypothetical protein D3C77_774750 [compost metagenome]
MSADSFRSQLFCRLLDKMKRKTIADHSKIVALAKYIRFSDRHDIIFFGNISINELIAFFIFKIKHRVRIANRSL